jgi:hypothetical protein
MYFCIKLKQYHHFKFHLITYHQKFTSFYLLNEFKLDEIMTQIKELKSLSILEYLKIFIRIYLLFM